MRLFHRRRRRLAELDARVADATAGAERAAGEVRKSEQRAESVQRHVVQPLKEAAEQNQFASLIRRSLINGGETHEG